jgi:hypothetical protein
VCPSRLTQTEAPSVRDGAWKWTCRRSRHPTSARDTSAAAACRAPRQVVQHAASEDVEAIMPAKRRRSAAAGPATLRSAPSSRGAPTSHCPASSGGAFVVSVDDAGGPR